MSTKVLIVEDDSFLANAYRVKLSKQGFEIKIAGDGIEALSTLKAFTPDVILLDLVMPNMDGFTFLRTMRADEKIKDIPVIVASNLGQKEDTDEAKKLGAIDFVIKSNLTMQDLVTKINAVTQKPAAA
jgi:DNA-binding response OmpR family regulator